VIRAMVRHVHYIKSVISSHIMSLHARALCRRFIIIIIIRMDRMIEGTAGEDPDAVEQIVRMGGCGRALLLRPLLRSLSALPSPSSIRQSPTLSRFMICSPVIDEGLGDELCGDRVDVACVCVCV
jgi:hypothetical protein